MNDMNKPVDGTVDFVLREQIVPGAVLRYISCDHALPAFSDSVVVSVNVDMVRLARPYLHVYESEAESSDSSVCHADESSDGVKSGVEFYNVAISSITASNKWPSGPWWVIVIQSTKKPASYLTSR
jgi:hypothetical protein